MNIVYKNKKYIFDDKVWNCVKEFVKDYLDNNENGKLCSVIDVGCGNGKNMKYLQDNNFRFVQGCDIDDNFLLNCARKGLNVTKANILNLPYKDSEFDFVFCNGVIHHLKLEQERKKAIEELLRISKPKAKIYISLNSYESNHYRNMSEKSLSHILSPGSELTHSLRDIVVKFKNKTVYYYLYKEEQMTDLFLSFGCSIIKILHECNNLSYIIEKK